VLTLPLAWLLINAGFSGNKDAIRKALKIVDYHLKRNMVAQQSHRKARLRMLKDAVV
jgi:hypothetical protein